MQPETASPTREFDSDMVLREEAKAIHGADFADQKGDELYRSLNGLNATALCLSGGGIRSATFALGVIEALAVHPRPASSDGAEKQSGSAEKSLLAQFNYLSTVSGGGYIGSWLSAWIARDGYSNVWRKLIGRREHPDKEPGETSWLRAYSNYLTPKLGLFSADTWTAVALYIRNLILNWLVILSALVLALLAIKVFAVAGLWAGAFVISFGRLAIVAFAALGALLLMYSLRFALKDRPSAFLGPDLVPNTARPKHRAKSSFRDESARVAEGADEAGFVKRSLLPALAAAFLLALYLIIRGPRLTALSMSYVVVVAGLAGAAIYALSWLWAWPPGKHYRPAGGTYWLRDFYSWVVGGAVYGTLVGAGVYLLANYDLWIIIGNTNKANWAGHSVSSGAGYFLIALIFGVPWIITAQITAEMIFVGLTNWQPHSDEDREWFGRSTGYYTVVAGVWLVTFFSVLVAAEVIWSLVKSSDIAKITSALATVGSALFSTLMGKSGKSSATNEKDKSGLLMRIAVPLGAILFLSILILAISYLLDYLLFGESLIYSSLIGSGPRSELGDEVLWLAIAVAVTGGVAWVAWTHVNINRFSIHALYRNRLIRGYLGASNTEREPNPFTGFDGEDNIAMAKLWPPAPGRWQPFHVVNIALNVVNSKRLAWQERKAESFTATPLHCGVAGLGYRRTEEYGDAARGGIALGTALAISGAAASPNMGYHSSPVVSLLLALFNVRLGWWLGNPGPPGNPDAYKTDGPRVAIKPFIGEMFGQTTDDRRYVYLSDGGHFENLGLYEMIRRRCRCIVVSDAGCDPNYGFEDLGNAVRKITIDLGVYIRFGKLHALKARSKDGGVIEDAYYAIGVIDYKSAPEWNSGTGTGKPENGYILYVKPGYHGTESAGIVAYATANAAFPHETTVDQFFSESQFESYRTLGFEIMDSVLRTAAENVDTIADAAILTPDPSRGSLRDLVMALDTTVVQRAEAARKPPPTDLARVVGALDDGIIAELRASLQRPG